MQSVDSFSFGQVCDAISNLNTLDILSDAQKLEIASLLLSKIQDKSSDSPAFTSEALNLIAQLDIKSPAILKGILPLLTNDNVSKLTINCCNYSYCFIIDCT